MEARTLSGAYDKISSHEELCAERYERINEKLEGLSKSIGGLNKRLISQDKRGSRIFLSVVALVISTLLALIGWLAAQVYALQPLRSADGQEPPARHSSLVLGMPPA